MKHDIVINMWVVKVRLPRRRQTYAEFLLPGIRIRHWQPAAGGYVALGATFLVVFAALAVLGGLTFLSLREIAVTRTFEDSVESHAISEGGLEDAMYRIVTGKPVQVGISEVLLVGEGEAGVLVSATENGYAVRSEGVRERFSRTLEGRLEATTTPVGYTYGAQVGTGGLFMENNSVINGSVYANGNITGQNSAQITGNAYAANTSEISGRLSIGGDAYAWRIDGDGSASERIIINGSASSTTLIDDAEILRSAAADTFDDSVVSGDAYYQTSISADTQVVGTQIQISQAPPPLPILPMPISDAQLDQWEAQIASAGVYTGPCPYIIESGETPPIGSLKVPCDVNIKNTGVLTLRGALWIAGNLVIENSAVVRLDPSYGDLSGLVIVDDPSDRVSRGTIVVQNSAQVLGSGTAGSNVMLVSRNDSAEQIEAIRVENSSSASIYYAPHGSLHIENNTNLKGVSAYKVYIENLSAITYESGLQEVRYFLGPGASFELQYWQEVE